MCNDKDLNREINEDKIKKTKTFSFEANEPDFEPPKFIPITVKTIKKNKKIVQDSIKEEKKE